MTTSNEVADDCPPLWDFPVLHSSYHRHFEALCVCVCVCVRVHEGEREYAACEYSRYTSVRTNTLMKRVGGGYTYMEMPHNTTAKSPNEWAQCE